MDEVSVFEQAQNKKKQVVNLWEKTGMLRGIDNPLEKEQVALLLDNQRIGNQAITELEIKDEFLRGYYPYFKRISLPLIRRFFNPASFIGFQIVSVQTMLAAEHSFLYRDLYGNIRSRGIQAKTRKIGHIPPQPDPGKYQNLLDGECDICEQYSQVVSGAMNREVVTDLYRYAPTSTQYGWKNRDDLESHVRMVMGRVEKQSGRSPNWILTTPELAAALLSQDKFESEQPMYKGNLGTKKVFSYVSCPKDSIIVGHKGDMYTSGYFYCPFMPLYVSDNGPGVPPEGACIDYGVIARYGKAMPFPEFYGKIQVFGYSFNTQERMVR
jgi:hypothetical protein